MSCWYVAEPLLNWVWRNIHQWTSAQKWYLKGFSLSSFGSVSSAEMNVKILTSDKFFPVFKLIPASSKYNFLIDFVIMDEFFTSEYENTKGSIRLYRCVHSFMTIGSERIPDHETKVKAMHVILSWGRKTTYNHIRVDLTPPSSLVMPTIHGTLFTTFYAVHNILIPWFLDQESIFHTLRFHDRTKRDCKVDVEDL